MRKIITLNLKDFFNTELNSSLRKISEPIISFDQSLLNNIIDLKESFYSLKISVGLAAPQIGINKRLIIVNLNKEENEDLVMINPVLLSNTGRYKNSFESCLSLPGFQGKVKRRDKIEVEYLTATGEKKILKTSGFMSRVILHEIDHLNGVLFVDLLENKDHDLQPINFKWE